MRSLHEIDREHKGPSTRFRAPEPQGLASWILRLLRSRGGAFKTAQKQLQLVEMLPLNGKRHLMLVECAGERFLVGGGPESVQTIVRLQNSDSLKAAESKDRLCQ